MSKLDWEVELGAVIGKPALNISREQALDHMLGYTLVNDVSERGVNTPLTDYPLDTWNAVGTHGHSGRDFCHGGLDVQRGMFFHHRCCVRPVRWTGYLLNCQCCRSCQHGEPSICVSTMIAERCSINAAGWATTRSKSRRKRSIS